MKKIKALALGLLCTLGLVGCGKESASVGVIGGADGPTAIFVASNINWWVVCGLVALVAVIVLVLLAIYRNKKDK